MTIRQKRKHCIIQLKMDRRNKQEMVEFFDELDEKNNQLRQEMIEFLDQFKPNEFSSKVELDIPSVEEVMRCTVQFLDKYLPTISSALKENIKESLQKLEYEFTKQNCKVMELRMMLAQIDVIIRKMLDIHDKV